MEHRQRIKTELTILRRGAKSKPRKSLKPPRCLLSAETVPGRCEGKLVGATLW